MTTSSSTALIPRRDTLEGFTTEVTAAEGLNLSDLEPLTTIQVHTCNSTYELTVSHGATVLVRGGVFFPVLTHARVEGASFGGSMLKVAWIGIGLRMEICAEGRRIVTSPVRSIVTNPDLGPQLTH